jgi:hypothetical protein
MVLGMKIFLETGRESFAIVHNHWLPPKHTAMFGSAYCQSIYTAVCDSVLGKVAVDSAKASLPYNQGTAY